jgi:asparagine synthase (glutamine-hydrolysing)
VLERYLPSTLFERPKRGFGVPIGSWLCGPLKGWAEDLLDQARLGREGFLRPVAVHALWLEHQSGRRDRQELLWHLLMFQAWHDHWRAPTP